MAIARKHFAKVQLEGEKPLRFFCNLNKKRLAKAQFKELHIVEKDSDNRTEKYRMGGEEILLEALW